MKVNMAAASYHPRILSPNYGKIGNVKPLTSNQFVVCSKITKPRSFKRSLVSTFVHFHGTSVINTKLKS